MPYNSAFENFNKIRKKELKTYFPETVGMMAQMEEWQEFRQAVQQEMMRPRSALFYINEIEDIAKVMVHKINEKKDDKGDLNTARICQEYALESINVIFLGSKVGVLEGSAEGSAMINNTEIIIKEIEKMSYYPNQLLGYEFNWYKRLVQANKDLMEVNNKHIKESMRDLDLENSERILAKHVRNCGKESTIPQIIAADALFAGINTAAVTLNLLLYNLASNQEVQEKLYNEIYATIGTDGDITEANVKRMPYLKACHQESQRMLPIIMGTMRKTQVDMVLRGYHIPAGTNVGRMGYFNSMHEMNFPEPDKFLPERWIRGCPTRHSADPFSNLPFGHGPRACVGQRFALLEIQVAVAKIIQSYRLNYTGNDISMIKDQFLATPSEAIMINYSDRN